MRSQGRSRLNILPGTGAAGVLDADGVIPEAETCFPEPESEMFKILPPLHPRQGCKVGKLNGPGGLKSFPKLLNTLSMTGPEAFGRKVRKDVFPKARANVEGYLGIW